MKDSADPLGGWDLKETLKTTGPANNDLYGGLYYYLKDLLRRFFNRLSVLDVSFHLTQMDAVDLPNHLNREKEAGYEFDRIEVGFPGDDRGAKCFPLIRDLGFQHRGYGLSRAGKNTVNVWKAPQDTQRKPTCSIDYLISKRNT